MTYISALDVEDLIQLPCHGQLTILVGFRPGLCYSAAEMYNKLAPFETDEP